MSTEGGSPPASPRRRVRVVAPLTNTGSDGPTTTSSRFGSDADSDDDENDRALATPTLSESAGHLRKNLSFKSLRDVELLKTELSNAVYRKGSRQDMKVYRPRNDEQVFAHALRGGLRTPCPLLFSLLSLSRGVSLGSDPPSRQVHSCSVRLCVPSSTSSSSSCDSLGNGERALSLLSSLLLSVVD